MKGYKGFNKTSFGGLKCRDYRYKKHGTNVYEGEVKICLSGFHACHELYQVWEFYPNNGKNVFYEVECGGDVIEGDGWNEGKFVCDNMKLVRKIDMSGVANFDCCYGFKDDFGRVSLNKKWNYINTEGKLLSETWFDRCYYFESGYGVVKLNNKYNYINTEGKFLSETWFDWADDFTGGLARVELNNKWNYINTEGKLLSDTWFGWCDDFNEGFGCVELNDKFYYIDKNGVIHDYEGKPIV